MGKGFRGIVGAGVGVLCAVALLAPAAAVGATSVLNEVAGSPWSTGTGSNDFGIAFSRTGLIATSDWGTHSVSLFSLGAGSATPVPGSPFPTGNNPWGIAFSPQGTLLAVVNANDADVSVYSASVAGLVPLGGSPFTGTGQSPEAVAFDASGSLLATASGNESVGQVGLFTVGANGSVTRVSGSPYPIAGGGSLGLAFSPKGRLLAAANDANSTVSLFRASSRGLVPIGTPYSTGPNTEPQSVAFSPDGKLLAVADNNSQISLFRVILGHLVPVPGSPFSTGIGCNPRGLSFSSDGRYLAFANSSSFQGFLNDGIFVFGVSSTGLTPAAGSPFPTTPFDEGPQAVAFSPNGPYLASANITGSMSLFTVNP